MGSGDLSFPFLNFVEPRRLPWATDYSTGDSRGPGQERKNSLALTWDVYLIALSWHEARPACVRKIMWRDHMESQSMCPGWSTSWRLASSQARRQAFETYCKSSGFLILNGSEMNVLIDLALFSEFCNRLIFWSHGVLGWLIMSSTVIVHMTGSKVLRFQAYLNSRLVILKFLFVCFWF